MTKTKMEWVATLHGQTGTVRIAYRSPMHLANGLKDQTAGGWMVASVIERERKTYTEDGDLS